jgi:TonB family protein
MIRGLLLAGLAAAALFACASRADAITEFCPARLDQMQPASGPRDSAAAAYSYELRAKTPRHLEDASIIADTDHGWYRWAVSGVEMAPFQQTLLENRAGSILWPAARSPRLSVAFPEPLVVRHAWVTSARATDEAVLGWGDIGEFSCQVPIFENRGKDVEIARAQSRAVAATSAPSPSPGAPQAAAAGAEAVAIPATVPFDSVADCPVPFKEAAVATAVAPDYPDSARESGYSGTVYVDVALTGRGQIIDTSIYVGSGSPQFDAAALRAARRSEYTGGTSYCQHVRGEYVFVATFQPF